jgi:type VI secretion system protein ImpL
MDGLRQQLSPLAESLPPSVAAIASAAGGAAGGAVGGATTAELATLYQQEILKECVPTVSGKYPFVAGGIDAPPGDVAKLFGQGGTFDTFFATRLAASVDPRNPAQWKTDDSGRAVGGPPSLPGRFQSAKEVREVLFPLGTGGPLSFSLTPTSFDAGVTQVILQVDSQTMTLRPNQQMPARFTWSPLSAGFASITIEGAAPVEARGAWAVLRLFDRAQVTGSGSRATVTFGGPGRQVRLQFDAQNAKNPITSKNLLKFTCAI